MVFYKTKPKEYKEGRCSEERSKISFEIKNLREMMRGVSERIIEKNYRELVEYHKRQYSDE